MLERAHTLLGRARARIRAAAEHDPHGWHHGQGDAPAGTDEHAGDVDDDVLDEHPDGHPDDAPDDAGRAPLGAPAEDAPDVDGLATGVSGPPAGGRPRSHRRRETPIEGSVPAGLRLAAGWSWRVLVVLVALFSLVWTASYLAVVVVPVLVA